MTRIASIVLVVLVCASIVFFINKEKEHTTTSLPQPTDTYVKMDGEDRAKGKDRNAWKELMHQAPEGVDWRAVEHQNRLDNYLKKVEKRKYSESKRGEEELLAEGRMKGRWIERGSNNQAGSMLHVNYFAEEDLIFGLSDGRSLWRGDRSGFNWEVVNDDLLFGRHLVEARYNDQGGVRYIASLGNSPVYSDDGGITWIQASGFEATGDGSIQNFEETDDGSMFILFKPDNFDKVALYRSTDDGVSWQNVYQFDDYVIRNFELTKIGNTDDLMIIEQTDSYETILYHWYSGLETLQVVNNSSPIGFGSGSDRANLNAVLDGDTLRLFVLSPEDRQGTFRQVLYSSVDTGNIWKELSILPSDPWNVGLFVSPSNPDLMLYGEVELYRSRNGGKFFSPVSAWWEYYDDILTKIHADIMDIEEFVDADGNPFIAVCNHGGLSQSIDGGEEYLNIGLFNLNISQYYSVATHPHDHSFVFAGSQDQGLQRGSINGDFTSDLDQVISGDYGHIVFSTDEAHMWTVYPWGWVSYYDDGRLGSGPTASYTLESEQESVWIPPLLAHPDLSQNVIFMAGGSVDGGLGSHMIRLEYDAATNSILTSQFDFDFSSTGGGEVSAMAISPIDHAMIFVATTNGHFFKSTDGGGTFRHIDNGFPGGHWLYGSCIYASDHDINTLYLSGSGYGSSPVWVSRDAGESWSPMANGLPQTMVFEVVPNADDTRIYAATEAGPYVYIAEEDLWVDLYGMDTPTQTYWSVEYLAEIDLVRFGTYGRGIWDLEVTEQTVSTDDIAMENAVTAYPSPTRGPITITDQRGDMVQIRIIDQAGRVVRDVEVGESSEANLDISAHPAGTYHLQIVGKNNIETKTIIKI